MQIPLEITFHHLEKNDAAEDAIREHVARLEQIHDRLIGCRVRVDKRADVSHDTIPPVVRVEISLPGAPDIVVAHEPDRLQRKFQAPDLSNAINEAFRIATRKLSAYKDQRTDYSAVSTHEAAHEFRGQIAEMPPKEDFGFVMTKEGGLLYFHRNSVLTGSFDNLRRGDDVSYVEEVGDTGPVATKVRVKANGNGHA